MVRRMTPEQRESFLAEVRVGVLSVAAEAGRAPLTTPIWYDYRGEGEVIVVTAPGSRKARLISEAGRFALCVQDAGTPYRYVTVEGPVVEVRPVTEQDRRAMAERYVPAEVVDGYLASTRDEESVVIAMRPDRWRSEDYSDVVEQLSV